MKNWSKGDRVTQATYGAGTLVEVNEHHTVIDFDEHATLGKLDGVVVDPCRRQVRYYVLERAGWFSSRHYLLPLGTARLLPDRRAVEVDLETDEIGKLEQVDPSDLPKFSDEDLLSAMFRPRAA